MQMLRQAPISNQQSYCSLK